MCRSIKKFITFLFANVATATSRLHQGRNEGVKGGTFWTLNQYGGAQSRQGAPKSPNSVSSTFFNAVHLLPKDFRF